MLSREAVHAPSLEVFMICLSKALSTLTLPRADFVLSKRLDYGPPEVLSHPSDSVKL